MVVLTATVSEACSGNEEGLAVHYRSNRYLDSYVTYTVGAIGLGMLPVAMVVAALFIP